MQRPCSCRFLALRATGPRIWSRPVCEATDLSVLPRLLGRWLPPIDTSRFFRGRWLDRRRLPAPARRAPEPAIVVLDRRPLAAAVGRGRAIAELLLELLESLQHVAARAAAELIPESTRLLQPDESDVRLIQDLIAARETGHARGNAVGVLDARVLSLRQAEAMERVLVE